MRLCARAQRALRHRVTSSGCQRTWERKRLAAASTAERYGSYAAAIEDPAIDAVASRAAPVPSGSHARGLRAGKHVLSAASGIEDFTAVAAARDQAGRVVMVGENDITSRSRSIRKMLRVGRSAITNCSRTS
jgi:predicted dehydrogenase